MFPRVPPQTPSKSGAKEPKLLDRLGDELHRRKYVPAMIHDYVDWVRRFIYFHHKQHPIGLGLAEIAAYIEYLAGDGGATSFQRTEAERALQFRQIWTTKRRGANRYNRYNRTRGGWKQTNGQR